MSDRKVIMYISMSLDGYLATKDDKLDWLDEIDHGKEDYGYDAMVASCDTYIVGKKTFDVVKQLTNGNLDHMMAYEKAYVITRKELPDQDNITFYNGDLKELIGSLKSQKGKNIYFDGGGTVAKLLLKEDLIDEYIIFVMPVILGDGKRLFIGETEKNIKLHLKEAKQFNSGAARLTYERAQ